MNLKFKKTDKRHTGNDCWQYIVVVERTMRTPFGNPALIQKGKTSTPLESGVGLPTALVAS